MLEPKKVKRAYYKASRFVHPDKLVNLSVEQRFVGKRIFDALSQAYAEFEESGTLLSMRMRILCIKYLDMQATGSPSERERATVCFWRAAPGEAGDVRYVERGEL